MANPLLIIIASIRRLARPGHLARGLPPVVQLAAAVGTLAVIGFSAITFFGGIIVGGGDGQEGPGVERTTASGDDNSVRPPGAPSSEGTPSMGATPLPTGSLAVVEVSDCVWGPPDNADSVADLLLSLKIKGNPEFSQQVPVRALTDSREWFGSFNVDEEDWDAEDGDFVAWGSVDLGLGAEDLGKRHDITVRADPNNVTEAFDPSNSETSVRVIIPAAPPSREDQELSDCTSPAP